MIHRDTGPRGLRVLKDTAPGRAGEFVPYLGMHHAVRVHEKAALDVTVSAANALRIPVLVYQGLGGQHRYNADRHHTFIVQGALAARGIAYGLSVQRISAAQRRVRRRTLDIHPLEKAVAVVMQAHRAGGTHWPLIRGKKTA